MFSLGMLLSLISALVGYIRSMSQNNSGFRRLEETAVFQASRAVTAKVQAEPEPERFETLPPGAR